MMKNTFAILALSCLLVFSACKKSEVETNVDKTEKNLHKNFTIDSVKVNDSIQLSDSLKVRFFSKMLVFPGIKDRKLLDSIYFGDKNIRAFSKAGLQALLEKRKNDYFNKARKDSKDFLSDLTFSQEWYSDTGMNVKSNINDYLHIQYVWGSYEGGAHDNYGFSERVFDLKNNKKVELKDITSLSESKLQGLLMKNINKINSDTTDGNGQVNNSEMLLVEVIPVTENFYFDGKSLYFHYSPYEIAAFAAGDITIPVSWQELQGTLNPAFKERMKIN
ncbi:RsiV family protein [Chryseobacterium sp. SSA4.19]|uniref:RsiV family protein n=1 Tax=Chryseobacterium sp. SSA4.19 TaxID=2919915 RepID=UPI001F4E454F|nr:RsiV family protein [Chryseobacterium sp. SSA4.19]MCJ8153845.1 RsiV family protein [Chryseobacterium sp. SSA4.19]